VVLVRVAEHCAVAQHGDRSVFTHGDDGGERVVAAGTAARRVTSTAERFDGLLGSRARNQPHPEPAQHPVGIEHGGAVDLGQGVTQRGEMKRAAGPEEREVWGAAPRPGDPGRYPAGR
jgi:hypothetical protein